MRKLEERIMKDGLVLPGNILKVDRFINHMIDPVLFEDLANEFYEKFKDKKINKILTIEASGIAIAGIASQYFDYVPVVFAKKTESLNLDKDVYESNVHSFTKKKDYKVRVGKQFLNKGERVLIIDDFLAQGCATKGMIDLVEQAGAELVGIGIVIEKGFQSGRAHLEDKGIRVESLVTIDKIEDGEVYFK